MASSPRYSVNTASHQLNPAETSRSTEGPTAAQWHAVKEEIRVLYLYEKKTLTEVRAILERRHGFKATDRMYKSRLSLWGFSKNSSDSDYQICAVLHKIRRDRGKTNTAFVINGHHKSLKDYRKYIKGRKMSEDEFLATALEHIKVEQLEDERHIRAITPEPEGDSNDSDTAPNFAKNTPEGLASCASSHGLASPRLTEKLASPTQAAVSSSQQKKRDGFVAINPHAPLPSSPPTANPIDIPSTKLGPRQRSSTKNSLHKFTLSPANLFYDTLSSSNATSLHTPSDRMVFTPQSLCESPISQQHLPLQPQGHSPDQRAYDWTDVNMLAYSTVNSNSIPGSYGTDNLDAWQMISASPLDFPIDDYNIICPKCHQPESEHFSSLCHLAASNMESPVEPSVKHGQSQQTPPHQRPIFNPSPDLPSSTPLSVPSSTRNHDLEHSCKWVAHCFSACIHYCRARYDPAVDPHKYVTEEDDPESYAIARLSMSEADEEFKLMIQNEDEQMVTALNQTMNVLQMHNQGEITRYVMRRARDVAQSMLGVAGWLTRLLSWMVVVADPAKLREQIVNGTMSSFLLENIWREVVTLRVEGEKSKWALGVMYCWGYMLNVEAGVTQDSDLKLQRLRQCENLLKRCYTLCLDVLGSRHLQSIQVLQNIMHCLERQGRLYDAIEYAQKAIGDSLTTLGKWHPRRLETMRRLGLLMEKVGRDHEAEKLYWEVLEARCLMLGRRHAFTLGVKEHLIKFLSDRGRWQGVDRKRIEDMFEWEDDAVRNWRNGVGENGKPARSMARVKIENGEERAKRRSQNMEREAKAY